MDVQVEAAEPVAAEGVGAALEHDGGGLVSGDHRLHDGFEKVDVVFVVDSIAEWDVEGVVFSGPAANVVPAAGSGEEVVFVVFVEGESHNPVGGEEGLLNAVAVVHVDVNVQHTWVVPEQLQNREHNVVDIAESRRFGFFSVVEPAGPVYRDVGLPVE